MSKRTILVIALGLALAPIFPAPAGARRAVQNPQALAGTVTFIYDGDTVRVRLDSGEEKKVRLIGVDAPEFDDPKEDVRLSAFLARRYAHAKLYRQTVRLTGDREKEDIYGRLLAYVWTADGAMFNEALVRDGFAYAYLKYPFDEAAKKRILDAEASARLAERGLWRKAPFPVVGAAEARKFLGQVVTFRFRCVRTFDRSRYRVLVPADGDFEAVIPLDVLASFPGPLDFEKRTMEVTGLVEEFQGRPQVVIGVPAQVRLVTPGAPFDSRPALVI